MEETNGTKVCSRAGDLVSYLYGEAAPGEAKDFEAHMRSCDSCRAELATFGDVREAVGVWRQQALGSFATPAFAAGAAQSAVPNVARKRVRSAAAALREFFTLSPSWMRAATAAAALLFCALSVIAVAYFLQKPQTVVVSTPANSGYTEKEVETMIAKALREQDEARVKEAPDAERVRSLNVAQSEPRPGVGHKSSAVPQLANNAGPQRRSGQRTRVRPAVEADSADYLPFTASLDDEKPISLSDLVDDVN
jgi:anti-sigma factor RsiW